MTISRVNPAGWAFDSTLTSAQINQLDIDHANALDKSTAGDTLSGIIDVAATGGLFLNASGASITAATSGAVIAAELGGQIQVTGPGSLMTTSSGGRIQLGDNDYPQFSATRTRTVVQPLEFPVVQTGYTLTSAITGGLGGIYLTGTATGNEQAFYLDKLHDGAGLSQVELAFFVGGSHSSLPLNFPSLAIYRVPLVNGQSFTTTVTPQALSTTPTQAFPNPGSVAAYQTGTLQMLTYTCNTGNTIDRTKYSYFAILVDENGSGAVAGTAYFGMILSYVGIADMRFP